MSKEAQNKMINFEIPDDFEEQFSTKELFSTIRDNKTVYAMTTFPRVIPYIKDGLIEVYRKALWEMYNSKLFWVDKYHVVKSATVVGNILGKWHPHGDISAYQSIVTLAQDYTNNYPLVYGAGNWGTVLGDPAAAPRYTECCLSEFFCDIVEQIRPEVVDFVPNFDGKYMEVDYIPFKIPILLVNGSYGIADSYITSIMPHNLNDVVDVCIKYIDNKNIRNDVLVDGFFPDFPNYAKIVNKREVEMAYKYKLPGNVKMKANIEVDRINNKIIIKDLPYNVTKDDVMMAIKTQHDKKHAVISKILDVIEVKTIRDGELHFEYDVIFEKNSNILEIARDIDKFCTSKTVPLSLVYYDGKYVHKVCIKDIIQQWYKTIYTTKARKINYQNSSYNHKKHILEGMVSIYDKIDDVISVMKKSESQQDAVEKLTQKFDLTTIQADAISKMALHQLNRVSKDTLLKNIADLDEKIKDLDGKILRIDDEIKEDLIKIRNKYGRPRRTIVMDLEDEKSEAATSIPMSNGALLWSYNQFAIFDLQNLVNGKALTNGLKTVKINNKNVKEIIGCHNVTKDISGIIIFTTDGCAKKLDISDIQNTNNWVTFKDEPVIQCCVPVFSDDDKIIIINKSGKIKITPSNQFSKQLSKASDVVCAQVVESSKDSLFVMNESGRYHLIKILDIPEAGKTAAGVLLNIECDNCSMTQIERDTDDTIITSLKDEEGYTYIMKTEQADLEDTNRVNKSKKLFDLEGFTTTNVNHIDIRNKEAKCIIIGPYSSSQMSIQNIRNSDMTKIPKRVPVNTLGIVTYNI